MRGAYEGFFVQAIVGIHGDADARGYYRSVAVIGESVRNPPGDSMTRLAKKKRQF